MNALPPPVRLVPAVVAVLVMLCASAFCATLEEALDDPALTWQGTGTWSGVETASARDGVDAARATHWLYGEQHLTTTVTGPGVLSLWWQMFSTDDEGGIYLVVDGLRPVIRSSETFTWEQLAVNVPAGTHTIAIAADTDTPTAEAMVDQVTWAPGQRLPAAAALGDPDGFWVQQGEWQRTAGAARDGIGDAASLQYSGVPGRVRLARIITGPAVVRYWRKITTTTPELYNYWDELISDLWTQDTLIFSGQPGQPNQETVLELSFTTYDFAAPATMYFDDVEIEPLTLAAAADINATAVFTGPPGGTPWYVTQFESDSRRTGSATASPGVPNGTADLRADFEGPGLLTWSWRVNADHGEYMTVSVNDSPFGVFNYLKTSGYSHVAHVLPLVGTNSVHWHMQWGGNGYNGIYLDDILFSVPAVAGLADSIEVPATSPLYATSGTPWATQSFVTHDGVDALELPVANSGPRAALTLPVTGPGVLTWWWRSDLPDDAAFRLHRLGRVERAVGGNSGWQQEYLVIRAGDEVVRWEFFRGNSSPTAVHRVWLDQVSFIPQPQTLTIADALDAPAFTWASSGDSLPVALPALVTHDGSDAVTLTPHHNNADLSAWVESSFTGPGYVTFWYKLQIGPPFFNSFPMIYLDTYSTIERLMAPQGNDTWALHCIGIPAGTHTVRWATLAGTVLTLDEVSFTPDSGYSTWAETHGLPAGQAAPLDDADGDSVPNLLEYTFDLPPLAPQSGSGTTIRTLPTGKVVMEFVRDIRRHDITLRPQVSADLIDWGDYWATPVSQDGFKELMRMEFPPGWKFARVKVSKTD